MKKIVLLRHGQAMYGTDDYDRLSDLGREQSALLGSQLLTYPSMDTVVCGPLRRHRETLESIRTQCELPIHSVVADWEELPAFEIMALLGPQLAARDDSVKSGLEADLGSVERKRAFLKVLRAWARNEVGDASLITFPAFQTRIVRGLEAIVANADMNTLVVSSGGAIGVALGHILSMPADKAVTLAWSIRNASITEVTVRGGIVMLHRFNACSHLTEERLRTFV